MSDPQESAPPSGVDLPCRPWGAEGVTLVALDDSTTSSIAIAWREDNRSRLVPAFVDLVMQTGERQAREAPGTGAAGAGAGTATSGAAAGGALAGGALTGGALGGNAACAGGAMALAAAPSRAAPGSAPRVSSSRS